MVGGATTHHVYLLIDGEASPNRRLEQLRVGGGGGVESMVYRERVLYLPQHLVLEPAHTAVMR